MIIGIAISLNLFGIVQAIPVPVSLIFNVFLVGGAWLKLKRSNTLIVSTFNHVTLFLAAWTAFCVSLGLLFTFEHLETVATARLFDGFILGFRIAMAVEPIGVVLLIIPLLFVLGKKK